MIEAGDHVECTSDDITGNGFDKGGVYEVVRKVKIDDLHFRYYIRNKAGDEEQNIHSGDHNGGIESFFKLFKVASVVDDVDRFDHAMGILK